MTEAGTLEPCLFAEFLRKDRDGAQPVYSAAVRPGIFFSDGTELTAEIAATSLANAGALRGRATVSARDGRVVFTMSGPSPRFENVLCQWNTGIVLERQGTFYGTGPYRLHARHDHAVDQGCRHGAAGDAIRSIAGKSSATSCCSSSIRRMSTERRHRLIDAAKRGEIDLTLNLSVNDILRHGINGYQPMMQPGNSTGILFFNNQRPMFRDVTLRRAIQHAINPDSHRRDLLREESLRLPGRRPHPAADGEGQRIDGDARPRAAAESSGEAGQPHAARSLDSASVSAEADSGGAGNRAAARRVRHPGQAAGDAAAASIISAR